MSRPKGENPFLDIDKIGYYLPPDHPANEEPLLTPLQSFAYPILLWFFDGSRNKGQGRTYLMACICIELAKRGERVYLNDLSSWPLLGKSEPVRNYFFNTVSKLLNTKFKEDIFEIRESSSELIYKGRRPR